MQQFPASKAPLYSKSMSYEGTPMAYGKKLGIEIDLRDIQQPLVDLTLMRQGNLKLIVGKLFWCHAGSSNEFRPTRVIVQVLE